MSTFLKHVQTGPMCTVLGFSCKPLICLPFLLSWKSDLCLPFCAFRANCRYVYLFALMQVGPMSTVLGFRANLTYSSF